MCKDALKFKGEYSLNFQIFSWLLTAACTRGVQYVHHGQSRGKRNTHKVCKKQVNFSKTGGKLFKVGGIIIFAKQGEMYWNRENKGEIRNLWSMTKKRSSEILADENREIFREKVKFWKFSRVWKFLENRGKSETEGNAGSLKGGWTPLACTSSKISSSAG